MNNSAVIKLNAIGLQGQEIFLAVDLQPARLQS